MSSAGRSVSPCFQYSVQSLGRDRFRFVSPYTTARLDKRQKNIFHTDIVPHSANTSEIRATKKPHNYHKIAVWQKDDQIRKSPLKFFAYHYSELEGDCQASIITQGKIQSGLEPLILLHSSAMYGRIICCEHRKDAAANTFCTFLSVGHFEDSGGLVACLCRLISRH